MPPAPPWWAATAVAAGVAAVAWRRHSLTATGAVAATLVGALATRASGGTGAFLIGWFVLASVLSRLGAASKRARTQGVVEKADRRDARQVMANGGVFATVVAASLVATTPGIGASLLVAGAGALAAAGADTWATEIGTWRGGTPWSLRTLKRVAPGTSGAVTVAGCAAALLGAAVVASLAAACKVVPWNAWGPVALGGVVGAATDTVAGAFVQERRHCPACRTATEQRRHDCGTQTTRVAGLARLDNDAVNLLATLTGAAVALWAASV